MTDSKYSIIIMRDDSRVKRMRLSPVWLRLFVYMLLILVCIAAGGAYASWKLWTLNRDQATDLAALNEAWGKDKLELERLGNMEQILKTSQAQDLETLLVEANSGSLDSPPAPVLDLAEVFAQTDTHQAELGNLQFRLVGGSARVSFELTNQQGGASLQGNVSLALITRYGDIVELPSDDPELRFSIQRFTTVQTSLALPPHVPVDEIFGLRVTITGDNDQIIYRESFPLYRILA